LTGGQFGFNDDSQWFATAAFYAYRAYGDKNLLNHTIANWDHVSKLCVASAVLRPALALTRDVARSPTPWPSPGS
jgi:hypothetical protein